MADERMSEDEVLEKLGLTQEQLQEIVDQGQLSPQDEGGETFYAAEDVEALAEGSADLDLEQFDEETEEDLFDFSDELEGELAEEEPAPDEGSDIGTDVVDIDQWEREQEEEAGGEEEVVDLEEAGEDEEESLDVGTDVVDIAAWDREQEEVEEEEGELLEFEEAPAEEEVEEEPEEEEEFVLEGEMDTEVVDVSSLEGGEEDLLGDIIEDVGEAPEEPSRESTGGLAGEETVDMETSEEPTAEITELEESAIEEETADITRLEEESFEGEELEDLLAEEEEEFPEEEEGEEYWPGEAAVAPEAEAPVSTWVVVVLVLVLAVQVIGGLFVVENALNPDYSTGITESLNVFKSD